MRSSKRAALRIINYFVIGCRVYTRLQNKKNNKILYEPPYLLIIHYVLLFVLLIYIYFFMFFIFISLLPRGKKGHSYY